MFFPLHQRFETSLFNLKNRLMSYRTFLNRIIILCFMGLIGFCLAKAISTGSFIGVLLALVSLGAGIYFLHILAKAKREMEMHAEETS
jgi:hypothetical protein